MATDFFGNEVDDDYDPLGLNPAIKPGTDRTPEEIAADQRIAAQQDIQAAARNTANINAPYQVERGEQNSSLLRATQSDPLKSYSRAGIELPFIGDIPGVGPIAEGAVSGAQRGVLNGAERAIEHPAETLLTGGANAVVAGGDAFVDDLLTGVARGVTGDNRVSVNAPLTPAQIYDPNGPIYSAGVGGPGDVNLPGVEDIGEGIIQGVSDLGSGIGNLFGGGGGGGGAPGGGSGYGAGIADAAIRDVNAEQDSLRGLGNDVLSGRVGAPNPADRNLQLSELERIQQFMSGPRAGRDVMGEVDQFLATPHGPSAAELELKQAQDDSMSDALSLARGVRGGAGATNRALRVAMAENAATQSSGARDLALLRAKEEEARRAETLNALGLKGNLAGGLDDGTLRALGLGGELASNVRGQGVQERGQTLQAGTGLLSDVLGSSTNVAGTAIPAYLRDDLERDKLGYELTPDQKLLFAGLGAGSDLLSMFL